jgi:hypothetical protein
MSGTNASLTLEQIDSPNQLLSGFFNVSYGNASISDHSVLVNVNDTASEVQSKLNPIEGVYGVNVTRSITSGNEATWLITFSSLRYTVSPSSLLYINSIFNATGIAPTATVKKIVTSASLPLLRLVVASNVTGFDLYIDGQTIGDGNVFGFTSFSYNSSAYDIRVALKKKVSYARVEVFNISTLNGLERREWLILTYPSLVSGNMSAYNAGSESSLSVSGQGVHVESVELGIASISSAGSNGLFSVTLGDPSPGCGLSSFKDPICRVDFSTQYSYNTPFPLTTQSITTNIETLSRVQKVSVTARPLEPGGALVPETRRRLLESVGYILSGTQYTVTFLKTTTNPSGSAVSANEGSWTPLVHDTPYSYESSSDGVIVPLLKVSPEGLPAGWFATVAEVQVRL